jgi:NAD(P)-dependent dehydrogenase (short-subunit alcohol dehydrogenase family)
MRVYGQALLEDPSGPQGWVQAAARFEAETDLDPAWLRSLMVAPLYSERSIEMLNALEPTLLAGAARLLRNLIETLLVSEFRLEETPPQKGTDDTASVQQRVPLLRSWAVFIRWSVWKWRGWPAPVITLLAQVAHTWCSFTQGLGWPIVNAVVRASLSLLTEIEDCAHPENRDDRRRPFDEVEYRSWHEPERLLRNAVARGAAAAPGDVQAYLERLTKRAWLRNEVEDLIEHHGEIPVALPKAYTDLLIAHLTPHERKPRYGGIIGYSDCFDTHSYHDAGIRHGNGFFPAAPDRAGFAALFERNEVEGLRLFHRLEMRASVYLRNYYRRRERRPLRPVLVPTSSGRIPLWGNEFEYQWSQGVLGSHVLGSCYLALDDWIWTQLGANRPMEELCRLVLQRNGLVATAALLICAIVLKVKDPGVLDAAAPFLATARLWDYEARRFNSLRSFKHPMGFSRLDRHFHEADRIWQRWRQRTFLTQDLLLRFHLQASGGVKALLEAARQGWTISDLATYEDEIQSEERVGELEHRLIRIRSDVRAQFDTNFFGTLAVIQTVLPLLRQQGGGHILGVSSVSGIHAGPISSFYSASKWAFEALHEGLSKEVAGFGIKVTLIEPAAYATDFGRGSSLKIAAGLDAYAGVRAQLFAYAAEMELGDPQATLPAVLKVIDEENPPLRVFLGTEGMRVARTAFAERLALWEAWEAISNAAQGVSRKRIFDPALG